MKILFIYLIPIVYIIIVLIIALLKKIDISKTILILLLGFIPYSCILSYLEINFVIEPNWIAISIGVYYIIPLVITILIVQIYKLIKLSNRK